MQRRMVNLTTIIILCSLFTIFLQLGVFYLLDSSIIAYLLTGIAVLICTHIFLELSLGYDACFLYSTLLIIFASIICLIVYIIPESTRLIRDILVLDNTLFMVHYSFYGVLFLNWFIPMVYCIFRNLMDRGPRFVHFKKFFISSSILFALFYSAGFVYLLFFNDFNFPLVSGLEASKHYIPFMVFSSYVEAGFYHSVSFGPLLYFLGISLLLFIPIGFYTKLVLQEHSVVFRFLIYIGFPIIIQSIKFLLGVSSFITDSILIGILGCCIGSILFNLLNSLYYRVTEEAFLYEHSSFSSFLQKYDNLHN